MRLYSVVITSLVCSAPAKWVDNLLTQFSIADVTHRSRGTPRGVAWRGVVRIALVRLLHVELGCGVREATDLASQLLESEAGRVDIDGVAFLAVDLETFEARLRLRLRDAIESAPRPPRGRPVKRTGIP